MTTAPDLGTARRLSRAILRSADAACVTILPAARSSYLWKGRIENAREYVLLMKTVASKLRSLSRRIRSVHPYQTPEFIALSVRSGTPDYLSWLRRSCAS